MNATNPEKPGANGNVLAIAYPISEPFSSVKPIFMETDALLAPLLVTKTATAIVSWSPSVSINSICCWLRISIEIDAELFDEHQVESATALSQHNAGAILPLEVNAIDCSSSAVRASLLQGQVPRQLLPAEVADYIDEHNLYGKSGD